eukprot:c9694_g1_i4.p1 GENE.c9694_g1_i4~~c9694_g1_i4.p1  ORF type:complete len:218 (+),score=39.97 c9694_g1_i4:277-930(+)
MTNPKRTANWFAISNSRCLRLTITAQTTQQLLESQLVIRRITVAQEVGEYVFVLREELEQYVKLFMHEPTSGEQIPSSENQVAEVFCSQILANHLQPTISLSRLTAILAQAPNLFLPPTKVIAMLKTWGFLTTRPSSELFSFSLPNIGPIIAMVLRGRKEALSFIRRKKFKDVLEKDLLKHKLKTSTLGSKFHMQDIVGAELVRLVKTPTGNLLQLI